MTGSNTSRSPYGPARPGLDDVDNDEEAEEARQAAAFRPSGRGVGPSTADGGDGWEEGGYDGAPTASAAPAVRAPTLVPR